jgi:hypothetical protein
MKTKIPTRAIAVILIGAIGAVSLGFATLAGITPETPMHNFDAVSSGHSLHNINQNISDLAWSLNPPTSSKLLAAKPDAILTPEEAYLPDSSSNDDYHCFLLDPKLTRDTFVTATNVKPDQASIVHHVILFKIGPENVAEARAKNQASGGKGWTCFGGSDVGDIRSTANSWLAAWAPGASAQVMPEGIGALLTKGSMIVMQVHYNLAAGVKADHTSAELTYAPEGTKLTPMQTILGFAPVELPCPDGLNTTQCNRDTVIKQNVEKYGQKIAFVPFGLLTVCKKKLEDYQKSVGDASQIKTSCEREVKKPSTLYAVAGHMHLRGQDIKLELNPGTGRAKTLLHIPKWDFHWQGNYWFKTPLEVQPGDVLKLSCTYDNSLTGQPMINGEKPAPRYITWAEGTTDEMCLSVLTAAPRQ